MENGSAMDMDDRLMSIFSGKHNMEILLTILRKGKVKASDLRGFTSNIGNLSDKLKDMESAGVVVSDWETTESGTNAKMYRLTEGKGLPIARLYYASRCIFNGTFDIESSALEESLCREFAEGGSLNSIMRSEFGLETDGPGDRRGRRPRPEE